MSKFIRSIYRVGSLLVVLVAATAAYLCPLDFFAPETTSRPSFVPPPPDSLVEESGVSDKLVAEQKKPGSSKTSRMAPNAHAGPPSWPGGNQGVEESPLLCFLHPIWRPLG